MILVLIACSTFLTFDTLTTSSSVSVPSGYGGLDWGNLYLINGLSYTAGYGIGDLSPPYSTYNGASNPGTITSHVAGSTFTFCSFYSAAAWENQTTLTIVGSAGGVQIYSTSVLLFTINATFISLNWVNIDTMTMTATYGSGSTTWYTMDNVYIG